MFSFLNKGKKNEFALEYLNEQTIPYACHYNQQTLLTKNGELMQVIRIEGYSKEMMDSAGDLDLRNIIRKAITENLDDRRIAFWFHTIRRKRNLDSVNYFSSTFAKDTHDSWASKNHWRDKFVNELYITILFEGNGDDKKNFALSFTPKLLKNYHLQNLASNVKDLNIIVLKMLDILKPFGGKRLEVAYDSNGAHSQILEFLSKIICLHSKRVAMPIQSIDNIFNRSKIAFGGNSIEILDEHKKHFAAIFSIKEYHEQNAKAFDKLFGIAGEYIISQTLNFADKVKAKKEYEYFNYILQVSKDEELRQQSGLVDLIESDKGKITDYAEQQMSFMVIGDSISELENAVSSAVKEMNNLGIVAIREDLNVELCFWSQLPGNFKFFRRSSFINTKNSASFASLNNNPSGSLKSIWGNALTLFRRKDGGPHFFNFHKGSIGHTIITGDHLSFKKTLLNFLISESTKYSPHILYLDTNLTSKVIVKALEGRHEIFSLEQQDSSFSFNPLHMEDTQENIDFLKNWLLLLIFPDENYTEQQKQIIFTTFDKFLFKMPVGSRQLSMLIDLFEDQTIKNNLLAWCRPNKLGIIFDNQVDEFESSSRIIGFNLQNLISNRSALKALTYYCLYMFSKIKNSTPTIVVLDDVNAIIADKFFAKFLPHWLDKLTENNAIALFVWDVKTALNNNLSLIKDKITTHLFTILNEYKVYQDTFDLSQEEIVDLKKMKSLNRNLMIKQGEERVIVELNLDGLDYTLEALNGEEKAIKAMNKAILEHGENPNIWIVPFYKNLFPNI